MTNEHVISEELWQALENNLPKRNWAVYNSVVYFLEPKDVHFFKYPEEADEFSHKHIGEFELYEMIKAQSPDEFLRQVCYAEHFNIQQSNILSTLKKQKMNNENFQYLSDNIKYMGFGENLKSELEKNMLEAKPEFQLHYATEMNKKPFEATLNFRKSDSTDMYFLNNYQAALEKGNGEKTSQTFYLNKGRGITAKEAFNLLEGRAVHKELTTKEGQSYNAWVQLDFNKKDKNNNFEVKQFHENYGFDLKNAVGKFPIAELKNSETENALLQSLRKGNIQSVALEGGENNRKMFIAADPQFKKVNLYDLHGQLQSREQTKELTTKMVKEPAVDLTADKKKVKTKENTKEKAQKTDTKSLLPKKRQSSKKAMGIS